MTAARGYEQPRTARPARPPAECAPPAPGIRTAGAPRRVRDVDQLGLPVMHIERELYADGRVLTRCNALLTLYRWGPGAEGASAPCGPCAVALAAERARDERGDP